MKSKYGIEYTIYEYNGNGSKKILNYRPAPGNIAMGVHLIKDKLGVEMDEWRKNIDKHIKKSMGRK